ncbi:MAG: MCE family protein [Planctomycetia bacterium]|nr:MCE family protein [Planctomycetia bacterium]
MSRALTRLQAILLGLAVLCGLGLAGFGVYAVGERQLLWSDHFHVRVGFAQVRGVEPGARVRIQGIDAGEVVAVEAPEVPGQEVLLRLRLAGKYRNLVRQNASAQIVGESLVGGKVVEIDPGSPTAEPVADNALIASRPTAELADVLGQVGGVLQGVRDGKGSLGKLINDDQLHTQLVELARTGQGTLGSIKQDADALKSLPIIRGYVKDAHKLLVRPDCEVNRQWFAESDLFEPGNAILTANGKRSLDRLAPWLEGLKHKGSDVVVASYAQPGVDPQVALTLTQKQAEAACTYLKDQHAVQKMSWLTRRDVTPIGLGINPPPMPEKDPLPAPRVEVLVFIPR